MGDRGREREYYRGESAGVGGQHRVRVDPQKIEAGPLRRATRRLCTAPALPRAGCRPRPRNSGNSIAILAVIGLPLRGWHRTGARLNRLISSRLTLRSRAGMEVA